MRGNEKRANRAARLRLLNKSYTYEEMASRMGGKASPAYLSQIANEVIQKGGRNPRALSDDYATRLERTFGLVSGWFDLDVSITDDDSKDLPEPYHDSADDGDNAILVNLFDAAPSMGPGALQPDRDTIIGRVRLSKDWARRNLSISSPDNLAMLTAYGDSMSPTFSDGDMLLVDRGVSEIKLDAIYVLALNDELFVKRVQRRITDRAVLIKSDNPLYDPVVLANGERQSLSVLGRVVWAWNGRKL